MTPFEPLAYELAPDVVDPGRQRELAAGLLATVRRQVAINGIDPATADELCIDSAFYHTR